MNKTKNCKIIDLVRAFESCTLPRSQWTHGAHLIVALWYLMQYSEPEARHRIRNGIQRYNTAIGIPTTPTGGYHETLTQFWISKVLHYLSCHAKTSSMDLLSEGLLEQYSDPNLPLTYYTRDRLFSKEARKTWVDPDLQPL
ncbi:MAG: hypothetical protein SW833_09500 [Cyanobacteriota bacterium]|nr:hypothetical protein [Cyanobacteriota bacterium]